jgi:hypothetical protein
VVCIAANPAAIYRPRQPRQSPLYKTILLYLPAFGRTYGQYLDAAVLSLARDAANLNTFAAPMTDQDEGLRWWAVVGVHLLGDDVKSAIETLQKSLNDDAHEIRMMAAWTLIRLGQTEDALACLDDLPFAKKSEVSDETMLHNIIDWIVKTAFPLVRKYYANNGPKQGKYGIGTLARIAEVPGL